MTTIAYNHKDKEIAVDSRFTRGEIIDTDKGVKVIKKNGVVFVCAGQVQYYERLVDMWFSGEADAELNCKAFVASKGKAYEYGIDGDGAISIEELTANHSAGNGQDWALAAMDFGKSAKDAVKYAMTRDMYTGGRVRVIKV